MRKICLVWNWKVRYVPGFAWFIFGRETRFKILESKILNLQILEF